VVRFEEVLNSLLRISNIDVYVTGSNSKFLSSDIVTEFRGRGDEIRIYPLSFAEFYNAYDLSEYEHLENVDRPENLQALETMENNIRLILQTYLDFTEEETAAMRELSEAKRTVLFEEKFQ